MKSNLTSKLSTFWRSSWLFKFSFIFSWFALGLSRIAIEMIPFKRLAKGLGKNAGDAPSTPVTTPSNEAGAKTIGSAVRHAAKFTPWNSNCFPQAITAMILLRLLKIPYAMFLGVSHTSAELSAHAWVAVGRVAVCGGKSFDEYTVVASFTALSDELS